MTENSPDPARQPSPSPAPDLSPTELSWRANDAILARWRAHTFAPGEWLAALEDERQDVIDALVDAWERDDAALVRELGARLVWGWISAGCTGFAEEQGVLLSFDDEILNVDTDDVEDDDVDDDDDVDNDDDDLLTTAEHFFENASDTDRYFQIVPVESRNGTQIFVAHIMEGDYPCESYFAGAGDSIDDAMEAVKALGYVSADDVRERYPASRSCSRAVSFEMIEKEAVARIEEEKRVLALRSTPRRENEPPSFAEDRKRFESEAKTLGRNPAYRRYGQLRMYSLERWHAESRGDWDTYNRITALMEQIASEGHSVSTGPPVAIADRRQGRPESPEEP